MCRTYLLLMFVSGFASILKAQTKDTLVGGLRIEYNTFRVYDNPQIYLNNKSPVFCIGIVGHDSKKTGEWYFFYPSGKILAKGKYVEDHKKGSWVYYPLHKKPVKVKWRKSDQIKSEVVFDRDQNPYIKETVNGVEYFNGRHRKSKVRFL